MPAKKTILDPAFREYVFNRMCHVPQDIKNELTPYEIYNISDVYHRRKYAEEQGLDALLRMLTRIGITWTITLAPESEDITEIFSEIITQSSYASKQLAVIKAMQDKKMFVFGSKDILVATMMAAQNCHTSVYSQGYQISNFGKKYKYMEQQLKKNENMLEEAMDSMDDLARMTLRIITTTDSIEAITGVTNNQLRILLAMYPFRNRYVSDAQILDLVRMQNENGVHKTLGSLCNEGYILREAGYNVDKRSKNPKKNFTIIDKGLNVVLKYFRYSMHNLPFS